MQVTSLSALDYVAGETFKDCADCPEMVVVPAGKYIMGSPASEEGRFANEGPQRQIVIPHPFAVGKYEVTTAEFERFAIESGYKAKQACHYWTGYRWRLTRRYTWKYPGFFQADSEPVVCVTWNDAQAYVNWLRKKTGKNYRLLSEAEWEYAARGGAATARHWGNDLTRKHAHYGAEKCCQPHKEQVGRRSLLARAGSFAPNGFGIYDTLGNVWEWVEDCWNGNYLGAPTDGSSWQNGDCERRVIRGGSWYSDPRRVRSAVRYSFGKDVNRTKLGFRVARSL